MSLTARRPPGFSTLAISRNTAGLSGARLMTQLLITQSAEASGSGSLSMVAWWNSTFGKPWPLFPLAAFWRASSSIWGVMSMPMALPVGPTFAAARNTSRPPPQPRSTTISPGRRLAVAVGLPQDSPILASAGIEDNSSGVYPKASATARTPACPLDRPLVATEPYFDLTASWIPSDMQLSFLDPQLQCLQEFLDLGLDQCADLAE